jgi:hypothetical protein
MAKSPKGMRGGEGSERARLKDEVGGVKKRFSPQLDLIYF